MALFFSAKINFLRKSLQSNPFYTHRNEYKKFFCLFYITIYYFPERKTAERKMNFAADTEIVKELLKYCSYSNLYFRIMFGKSLILVQLAVIQTPYLQSSY